MVPGRLHGELALARTRALKLSRVARDPSLWRPLAQGVLAAVEHAPVAFAPSYGTVLDIGASRGQFALFASRRFPDARLICFEPLPGPRAKLERVLGDRAEVHQIALGAESGTSTFHVSAEDDSSSLLPIGGRQVSEFPQTAPAGEITVEVGVLSDYLTDALPAPRLLKIDVQGGEAAVLEGAGDALALADAVYAECSFVELYEGQALAAEVVARLREEGLQLAGVWGLQYSADGAALQADFLFTR